MAQKIYTINGAGQRYSYTIPFANTPDSANGGIAKPGGTLTSSISKVRIGCDQTDRYNYSQGATALIGRFSFTTDNTTAKIELKKLEWNGKFGQAHYAGKNPISQPKCLVTKIELPENYLNIWTQGTSITISNNIKASAENVLVYNDDFSATSHFLDKNTIYYVFVFDTYNYPKGVGNRYFHTGEEGGSLIVTTNETNAVVYIDNGTTFEPYEIYIDNGSSWDLYQAYIDNGSSWEPCG